MPAPLPSAERGGVTVPDQHHAVGGRPPWSGITDLWSFVAPPLPAVTVHRIDGCPWCRSPESVGTPVSLPRAWPQYR